MLMEERKILRKDVDALRRRLDLANKKLRNTNTDRVMMKMMYPQRVWRCGFVVNCTLVVVIISWFIIYFV